MLIFSRKPTKREKNVALRTKIDHENACWSFYENADHFNIYTTIGADHPNLSIMLDELIQCSSCFQRIDTSRTHINYSKNMLIICHSKVIAPITVTRRENAYQFSTTHTLFSFLHCSASAASQHFILHSDLPHSCIPQVEHSKPVLHECGRRFHAVEWNTTAVRELMWVGSYIHHY